MSHSWAVMYLVSPENTKLILYTSSHLNSTTFLTFQFLPNNAFLMMKTNTDNIGTVLTYDRR